jgi:hypothetical protein
MGVSVSTHHLQWEDASSLDLKYAISFVLEIVLPAVERIKQTWSVDPSKKCFTKGVLVLFVAIVDRCATSRAAAAAAARAFTTAQQLGLA